MSSIRSFNCSLRFLRVDFLDLFVVVEVGPLSQLVQPGVELVMAFRERPKLLVRLQQLPAKPTI